MARFITFLIFISAFRISFLNAQTCCSGGVPLAANLGLPSSQSKALQFRLSYDLNILKTLKFESETLNDRNRTRRTHSVLMETGYSINNRLSVDLFYSWIRQEREITNVDFCLLIFIACNKDDENAAVESEWLIPIDQVFDGGPGKDGIPSVDSPGFIEIDEVDFMDSSDLIIAIKVGEEVKGYPHPILDWHEIVNDVVGDLPLALTYCLLTGTGVAWDREVNGEITTFGVSGLLYNSNLIPYDRKSDSNWSQMLLESVEGQNSGNKINTYPVLETTWNTFKNKFPTAMVMSKWTGFSRSYGSYPYGDYRTNHDFLIFPVENDDDRRPRKERGLSVIINGEAKFYPFDKFKTSTPTVVQDNFKNTDLVVFGSEAENYLIAYERELLDGTLLDFSMLNNKIMDNEGNEWDLFGYAIAGPRAGEQLQKVDNFIGYWFSFGTFYPDLEIY